MERMKEQALRYGTRVVSERIRSVDFSTHPFLLTPNYSEPVIANTVIVATGAMAKWIGLDNEMRLAKIGGGVSACAVCDGALPVFRKKVLAVVGGGDTAMEEAMYLTKFASEVVIIHRRDSFRASKVMAQRVLSHKNVRVIWNSHVVDVLGDDMITGIAIENVNSGARSTLDVGGLFVAIGHAPNTEFLNGQLELTPYKYVKVASWRTVTSVPGVFAAGDVLDDYYRQAITSAGSGCMAALEAERWLAHQGIGESPVLDITKAPQPPAGSRWRWCVIVRSLTVGPVQENTWLIIDETTNRAILVDPGEEGERLLAAIDAENATLTGIWLTHAHFDHIGAIAHIQRERPVPIWLHPLDRPLYDNATGTAQRFGLQS